MLNEKERKAKPVKKANKINNQVEERLHALIYAVDHCGEGIAISNMDGVLQYTNNAFAGMHGYKPDELPGKHLSIFHAPEQMPAVEAAKRQLISTGSFIGEIWHSRRNGSVFLSQMNNTLFMDNSGTPIGLIATLRDITKQKKAEESLKQTTELLQSIMDSSIGEIIAATDPAGIILSWNEGARKLLGYESEEVVGKESIKIFHSEEYLKSGIMGSNIENMIATGKLLDTELTYVAKDSRTFPVRQIVTPRFDEDGKFIGMLGMSRDITEQKNAEKMLRKSEEMYRTLCKNIHGMVYRGRLDWTTQFISKSEDIAGYSSEEFTSRELTWKDVVFEEDRERVVNEASKLAEKPSTIIQKYRIIAKDGSICWVEDHKTSRFTEEGIFDGVDGIAFNVTERERLKAELENYKEKVLKAQRHAYISSMGTVVAHQVNQPLTMVSILMGRVIEQIEEESCCPASLKNAREALAEVKKAASIIRKFRQYFEYPVLEAVGEKVNVSHTANSIISMLSEGAEQAKINISAKGLDELPEVEINETALEQIFLIILQNAIEAADGRKQHKLDIIGKFTDVGIELQFSDDCCGIAPENLEQIFEPFFSTKSYDKGMGLGLDIVQQILTSCGGEIRAESQLGKGTTFYATLPISNIPKRTGT